MENIKKDIYLFKEEFESDIITLDDAEDKKERIVACRGCNNKIAGIADKISFDDHHIHTFANPSGILFEIGIYGEAGGLVMEGAFSDEFTWFKGYSWRIALCSFCLIHMGWMFQNRDNSFFGIISDRIYEVEE